MDGTGPGGYNLDIPRCRWLGYSIPWYGAGFIDYMAPEVLMVTLYSRMRNSNVNTEAFMRTGNMSVRYEITNEGPKRQTCRRYSKTLNNPSY